jgi:hypothetical protein
MTSKVKKKKARKQVQRGQAHKTPPAELIRITDTKARRRAIMILGETRDPYYGFADFRFLVTREQLAVLRSESIPFEIV